MLFYSSVSVTSETTVHTQKLSGLTWKNKYQDLANKVRDLPLEKVAHELGLDPDPMDKHKWLHSDHQINITLGKFYDWKELKGGGGAIDLVMHVNQCNFKQSLAWLNDRFGESATLTAVTYQTRQIIQSEPPLPFIAPTQDSSQWQRVRSYLKSERRLPSAVVDNLYQQGLIYADSKQNLVSIRRDLSGQNITGASLRGTAGTDNSFKGLARGSKRKDGWFYFTQGGQFVDPIQRAVLLESPIDAMSFAVLDRTKSLKTLYLSTDGAGTVPLEFLRTLPALSVIVALDNDQAGEEMAQRIIEQLPNQPVRFRPLATDWNSELKNTFNLNLEQQQQREPEQKQSRGLSL